MEIEKNMSKFKRLERKELGAEIFVFNEWENKKFSKPQFSIFVAFF